MNITAEHRAARNQASVSLADIGGVASRFEFYTAQGGTLLAIRTLAKPCGTITAAGRISFNVATAAEQVMETGVPTYAIWRAGDGVQIADGTVSGPDGSGTFKLQGTATDVGGVPTLMIYEGGLVDLVLPALLG